MKRYLGILDPVEWPTIKGWVFDTQNMVSSVTVSIYVDDRYLGDSIANLYREKVKKTKGHPNGMCGFTFTLPNNLNVKRRKALIRIAIKNTNINLINSPQSVSIPLRVPTGEWKRIFFMHIAKTAGTSVNNTISTLFPSEKIKTHIESISWKSLPITTKYDFISGHVKIKEVLRNHNLKDFLRVTILRDPYQQLISHLRWLKHVGQNPKSGFFKSHPLAIQQVCNKIREVDFSNHTELEYYIKHFEKSETILFNNCQTRYFINDYNELDLNKSHLDEAIQSLSLFDIIGLNNDLPRFYLTLKSKGFPAIETINKKLNVQKNSFGLNPNDSKTESILRTLIEYDQMLYQTAEKKIYEEINS